MNPTTKIESQDLECFPYDRHGSLFVGVAVDTQTVSAGIQLRYIGIHVGQTRS